MPPIRPDDHAYRFRPGMLRELREGLKLTQAQMADLLELPVNTLSRWETGSNLPDANALAAIYSVAAERGVTPQFFEERRTPVTDRANRQNIVIHWDYQNFALASNRIVRFAERLKQYLAVMYPQAKLISAKAFTSAWHHGDASTQLHNSGFHVLPIFQDVDANLIRDAETTFSISTKAETHNPKNPYEVTFIAPVSMLLSLNQKRAEPLKSVYVLIANDGDYANLLSALKNAGADVYVCGSSQCSQKLLKAVGQDRFIPLNRPDVILECLKVVRKLNGQPTPKSEFGNLCRKYLANDGWDEFPDDTGFSLKRPYASALQHMVSMGIVKTSQVANDPNRIIITEIKR